MSSRASARRGSRLVSLLYRCSPYRPLSQCLVTCRPEIGLARRYMADSVQVGENRRCRFVHGVCRCLDGLALLFVGPGPPCEVARRAVGDVETDDVRNDEARPSVSSCQGGIRRAKRSARTTQE